MTTATIQRVAEGATLLDEREPGWAERVYEERIEERSVLVQLFGPFRDGSAIIRLLGSQHDYDPIRALAHAADFGFAVSEQRFQPGLTRAWRAEVAKRRQEVGRG